MTIRPATATDIPTLVAQTQAVDGGDPRAAAWFADRAVLVAVDGDRVVGHTAWTQHPEYAVWDQTVVDEAYRGQGIGRQLMEARAAQTPGRVFGACKEENVTMVHLLHSLGFHICQRIPGGYHNGEALLWARRHGWEG